MQHPVRGDTFVLDAPTTVPAVWGRGDDVLWAQGEPFMIAGPQGVGKTTLAQQLALARAGVLDGELLGFPVAPDARPVMYVAADRPAQAARSMRRMVAEGHRRALRERLLVWRGPLPFNVVDDPSRLADWIESFEVGSVYFDSLKDIAVGLADDAVGAAVNVALQAVVARGVEVCDLHHQRKAVDGRSPRRLEDVYGSTWITAGHGSVALVWGEPGDPYVELRHLKSPAAEVGPLSLQHDHERGRTTLPEPVDLLELASDGVTAVEAARAIYGKPTPDRNDVEKARRRLEKLRSRGELERDEPERGDAKTYRCVTHRDGSRDPFTLTVTEPHDLALQPVTEGVTPLHAATPASAQHAASPLKGGRAGERDTDDYARAA